VIPQIHSGSPIGVSTWGHACMVPSIPQEMGLKILDFASIYCHLSAENYDEPANMWGMVLNKPANSPSIVGDLPSIQPRETP